MNPPPHEPMDLTKARKLTAEIRTAVDRPAVLVAQAYRAHVWEPLGYRNWRHYCNCELRGTQDRLSRRAPLSVRRMAAEGMSTRAIAAATGIRRMDVASMLTDVPGLVPAKVPAPNSQRERTTTAQEAAQHDPPAPPAVPFRTPPRTADQVISNLVFTLRGMCQVIEEHEIDPATDRAQAASWARDLAASLAVLRRFTHTIKEFSRAEEAGHIRHDRDPASGEAHL